MERGIFIDTLAFAREHLGCAEVSVDVSERGEYGYAVSVTCTCGGRMLRWLGVEQAERELRANAVRKEQEAG